LKQNYKLSVKTYKIEISGFSEILNKSSHQAGLPCLWLCLYGTLVTTVRDGFRECGALGHLGFWGPTLVWPIWPFVWKEWKYAPLMGRAPSKIYLLWC